MDRSFFSSANFSVPFTSALEAAWCLSVHPEIHRATLNCRCTLRERQSQPAARLRVAWRLRLTTSTSGVFKIGIRLCLLLFWTIFSDTYRSLRKAPLLMNLFLNGLLYFLFCDLIWCIDFTLDPWEWRIVMQSSAILHLDQCICQAPSCSDARISNVDSYVMQKNVVGLTSLNNHVIQEPF